MKLDPECINYHPEIDSSIPENVRFWYDQDPENFRKRLLAERARLYVPQQLGLSLNYLSEEHERLGWALLKIIFLSGFLVLLITGFGVLTFGGEIWWILGIVGLSMFFTTLSLLALISLGHQWWNRKTQPAVASWLMKAGKAARKTWYHVRKVPIPPPSRLLQIASQLFQRNAYAASLCSILLSNLYGLLMASILGLSLMFFLLTRNVDYQLPSSLISSLSLKYLVHFVGTPLTWAGLTVPSDMAIEWALNSSVSSEDVLKGEFRREWSRFILGLLGVYLIAPRLLIIGVVVLIAWSRSRIQQGASNEIEVKICQSVLRPPDNIEEVDINDAPLPPPTQPQQESDNEKLQPITSSSDSGGCPEPKGIFVVGFNLDSIARDTPQRLAQLDAAYHSRGNLNGAKQQLQFVNQINVDFADSSLVVLFSLCEVPTVPVDKFLTRLIEKAQLPNSSQKSALPIQVVLTDGLRACKLLNDDLDALTTRKKQWTLKLTKIGIPETSIHVFDLTTSAGLKQAHDALLGDSNGRRLSGKYRQAISLVRKHFQDFTPQSEVPEHDQLGILAGTISTSLAQLYQEESNQFHQLVHAKPGLAGIQSALANVPLPNGVTNELVASAMKSAAYLRGSLSPSWITGGALAGICVGVISLGAAAGTAGIAAIPLAFPMIASYTVTGGAMGQFIKSYFGSQGKGTDDTAQPNVPYTLDLSQVLQAALVQILVLELQGNPEEDITAKLRSITDRLSGANSVRDINGVNRILDQFEAELAALEG